MTVDRLTRVNELSKREIGELLYRVINEEGFDLAAVTITRVETSRDLREARVRVSIRDHLRDRDRLLSRLRHHRGEFQHRINADITLKRIPRLIFELDTSVEEGDRVLALLSRLIPESDTTPNVPTAPSEPDVGHPV